MKTTKIFSLLIIVFFTQNYYPQNNLNYYPFNIGNKWFFIERMENWDEISPFYYRTWILEIIKDTLLNNDKVYRKILKSYEDPLYNEISFERIDTLSRLVYRYDPNSDSTGFERLIFDFTKKIGDTIYSAGWMIVFENRDSIEYFGRWYSSIAYSHIYGYAGYGDHYLEDIGQYKYTWAADFVYSESFLKGCFVDGILYGDTLLTSLNYKTDNNPDQFTLYQNYPNPFNNSTIISFYLPFKDAVTIKIFDELGRQILNLINQEMNGGLHKVYFNAAGLSSGVYFYRVNTNKFSKCKKFIILK